MLLNLEHAAPLGEVAAVFLILSTAIGQAIEALRRHFFRSTAQRYNTRVDLYRTYTSWTSIDLTCSGGARP